MRCNFLPGVGVKATAVFQAPSAAPTPLPHHPERRLALARACGWHPGTKLQMIDDTRTFAAAKSIFGRPTNDSLPNEIPTLLSQYFAQPNRANFNERRLTSGE